MVCKCCWTATSVNRWCGQLLDGEYWDTQRELWKPSVSDDIVKKIQSWWTGLLVALLINKHCLSQCVPHSFAWDDIKWRSHRTLHITLLGLWFEGGPTWEAHGFCAGSQFTLRAPQGTSSYLRGSWEPAFCISFGTESFERGGFDLERAV